MAKKPRKSMDDPRNWGGGSDDERRRKAGARGDAPQSANDPRGRGPAQGRRDPRSIGAPQQAPVDWGDFEWTPPRDLRPPSDAPAPAETTAAGAWKDFDTTYPEESEQPPAPVVPTPVDARDRRDPALPPDSRRAAAPPAVGAASSEAADDDWRWVGSPSGPGDRAAPLGSRARDERGPSAGAGVESGSAGAPAGPRSGEGRAYHSYQSKGGRRAAAAAERPSGEGRSGSADGRAPGAGTDGLPLGRPGSGGHDGRGSGGGDGGGIPGGPDRPDGRRLVPAGSILIVMVIGLVLAALLNAQSLQRAAESMHVGAARSLMLALVKPVVAISSTLRIDKPRAAIEDALGRGEQEQTGTHTRTPEPTPSAKPSGKPSPGKTGSPKPSDGATAGVFKPTKDHPLALWVGGDSMAMVFGESVVAMADRTGVIESALDYHVSSGLSRPDFFDWPARIKAEMKSFQPDVAVFASGANDGQGVEYEGQVVNYGSKEWLDLYHKRVGAAMDLLGGDGARQVWWVGMPIARDPEQSAIYKTMDKVYIEEAKKRPFVHYLDTYEMFSDKNGNYNDYLTGLSGKTELMRQGDGIHWSRAGGDLAAAALLEQIAKLYKFDFQP